eukprot:6212215-Pleurochrysis_carterae.AAC.1
MSTMCMRRNHAVCQNFTQLPGAFAVASAGGPAGKTYQLYCWPSRTSARMVLVAACAETGSGHSKLLGQCQVPSLALLTAMQSIVWSFQCLYCARCVALWLQQSACGSAAMFYKPVTHAELFLLHTSSPASPVDLTYVKWAYQIAAKRDVLVV